MGECEDLLAGGRRCISPSLAAPLENEDLLSDILLRLSPAPSSLPRASVVCKLWRRVVSDPAFVRRFRAHHSRNSPFLGFFYQEERGRISFKPTLEPPDRIPPEYFSLTFDESASRKPWVIVCSRHGLVLLFKGMGIGTPQILVWDPVTGDRHHVTPPPKLDDRTFILSGEVLRDAGDVYGCGHSSNFKVVLLGFVVDLRHPYACVYSSDTGMWGDLIPVEESPFCLYPTFTLSTGTLISGSLYWLLYNRSFERTVILEFDVGSPCISVIAMPLDVSGRPDCDQFRVMRCKDGELGFLLVTSPTIQLWKRVTLSDGYAGWVLGETIDIYKLLLLDPEKGSTLHVRACGFSEDDNVLLLREDRGSIIMIQLDSKQLQKPSGTYYQLQFYYPFRSVYTAGIGIGGRQDGVERNMID